MVDTIELEGAYRRLLERVAAYQHRPFASDAQEVAWGGNQPGRAPLLKAAWAYAARIGFPPRHGTTLTVPREAFGVTQIPLAPGVEPYIELKPGMSRASEFHILLHEITHAEIFRDSGASGQMLRNLALGRKTAERSEEMLCEGAASVAEAALGGIPAEFGIGRLRDLSHCRRCAGTCSTDGPAMLEASTPVTARYAAKLIAGVRGES